MERDELGSWLRLSLTPGIGNASARRLLAAFGPPENIFRQSAATLQQVVSAAQSDALLKPPDELAIQTELTWQWVQAVGDGLPRRLLTLADSDYPASLLQIEDPPLMMFLLGRSGWPAEGRAIGVVGSRNPTAQGSEHARAFSRSLVASGWTVVSGLALGIDGAAHEGALDAAELHAPATLAVVGTGLDRVYPGRHRELARRIAENGLVISEYLLGTPALAANFPKRNRIIAGLCRGTLVVEAALQSGSLITARLAAEQGREVFAIPGSIHSTQSRGCHALIKQGAKLVESVQDILEELGSGNTTRATVGGAVDMTGTGTGLLEQLGFEPTRLDALVARTGLSAPALQAQLLELELDGLVARLPGGLFQRQLRA